MGNQKLIEQWRENKSIERTKNIRRPSKIKIIFFFKISLSM